MKRSIASILSAETGIGDLTVAGALFWLCMMALICLSSGCSTVRTAWNDLAGSPADKAQQAAAKVVKAEVNVAAAKDRLVADAHSKVVLAEMLSRNIGEQTKTATALKSTLNAARADLDTARGPKAPDELSGLRTLVEQLLSDNAKAVAAGEQALALLDEQSGKSAVILRAALATEDAQRARADKADAAALDWGRERDATARKWDRLWLWIWIVAGLWVAAQLLPLVAKFIPALIPAATVFSAVIAPAATRALSQAKGLGRDASAALHNVMATVEAKAPAILAEAKAIKAEWITQADGTAARHDEALREAQQL